MVKLLKREPDQEVIIQGHKLTLTNLDKIFWEKEHYTKGDLIRYYMAIAPYILPHIKDRPMVLNRYPDGISGESFFQKNVDHTLPNWIKTVKIQHENRKINYLVVTDEASLIYVINLGCIELNPFHSTVDHLDNPDYLVIDLDPLEVSFQDVIETALAVHEILEEIGATNVCKTSGATGLHIYVPLAKKYTNEQTKQFAELIASLTHQKLPKITSIERNPEKRKKRVYVDFLQNNNRQTLAAPYCVRPRPHATVSAPLNWSEVKPGLDPQDYTITTILKRVKEKGDLFKAVLGPGVSFEKALKRLQSMLG